MRSQWSCEQHLVRDKQIPVILQLSNLVDTFQRSTDPDLRRETAAQLEKIIYSRTWLIELPGVPRVSGFLANFRTGGKLGPPLLNPGRLILPLQLLPPSRSMLPLQLLPPSRSTPSFLSPGRSKLPLQLLTPSRSTLPLQLLTPSRSMLSFLSPRGSMLPLQLPTPGWPTLPLQLPTPGRLMLPLRLLPPSGSTPPPQLLFRCRKIQNLLHMHQHAEIHISISMPTSAE
ncbi:hypothetical protein Q8A73_005074 [Channa argus]|nr:hypothetical protein Q8A73_005074 [Channa argus]